MTSYKDFLNSIPVFDDFLQVSNDQYFKLVPENWGLILTDVKGSTKAVQAGKHREVNMIGAACITAILNELNDRDLPFVFGGDGASLLVPPLSKDLAQKTMAEVQNWSMKEFGLELRSAYFDLSEVYKEGHQLLLGKHRLSPGNHTYQFRGGALKRAEDKMKQEDRSVRDDKAGSSPNLEGLTCRWEPLTAKKDLILTVLVSANGNEASAFEIYKNLLKSLRNIIGGDFKYACPVQRHNLKIKWPPETLLIEAKSRKGNFLKSFFLSSWESFVAYLFFRFNLKAGLFNPERYKEELISNSDFQKYDDLLRMVLDCSSEQVLEIEKVLTEFEEKGELVFGTHKSNQALMTCLVFSATQNQHLHFIDGAQGGYTLAAVELKKKRA
ncbi:DUF3095 domain-containing protein [Bdellovibrio reynosensis]|uniref:DUF3095 domain-containing protein n=1 Tax=Bdellovibrio reynosensis TaxID=2835041 RepID=A0ABY4C9N9_9BACT|nr:DUF3095 domain-containing protein [Bdellovibrio reynosensis]UOF00371.1 DUF3095 domain-containing protein [Bdellovibrio reynosensis]